jgi:hydroxymethylpyrimidine pyrophosphatase-like HAD family hydrolase
MTSPGKDRTLYVSDLDRTLLRSDGTLSTESARLINAALEDGVLFTYATARSFSSSRRATESLRLVLPLITYGGTITTDPHTGAPADIQLLEQALITATIASCENRPTTQPLLHTFEQGSDWLRWRPERQTAGISAFLNLRAGDPRLRPITRADPIDLAAVFYVAILAPIAELMDVRTDLRPTLDQCADFLTEDPSTPGFHWLEFHSPEGTKARAIQRLMATLGVDRLVVFGDGPNDAPMFDIADESYAVANAIPELKAIATAVLDTNDQDAVARWIDARQ